MFFKVPNAHADSQFSFSHLLTYWVLFLNVLGTAKEFGLLLWLALFYRKVRMGGLQSLKENFEHYLLLPSIESCQCPNFKIDFTTNCLKRIKGYLNTTNPTFLICSVLHLFSFNVIFSCSYHWIQNEFLQ